jgi:hypothetical protein
LDQLGIGALQAGQCLVANSAIQIRATAATSAPVAAQMMATNQALCKCKPLAEFRFDGSDPHWILQSEHDKFKEGT